MVTDAGSNSATGNNVPDNNAFARSAEPPAIAGVRRSFIQARGVRFHVTEAGDPDGRPVIALHGWPQHHWAYRDLLGNPPPGLRIIAPDLPGYGWSGPAPHRWYKEEIATDVLALADAMGLDHFLLLGHDWGGFVGYRMVLAAPERIDGYLVLNMAHPWQSPRTVLPHLWRFLIYQPMVAAAGVPLQQRTDYLKRVIYGVGPAAHRLDPATVRVYTERFRDPVVARAARDTYRTFLLHELPDGARHPEKRRATVPIRALFGLADIAVHRSLAAPKTANADDYTFEGADTGHFIVDERPDLVRARLISLAEETKAATG
ncbi:alpha/beta fold hydrolase [Mycolicibacterium sp. YH-1]|uniref:alpha/beta fold hydrolase n=1 Tax=Mycolicibacterium sp. YH-1 TaxID=2908837 RepID=UPI001F4C0E64|nr:alpha/beta hydrolase [Mycolicibacterium sp. YH-1]UNB54024.1 alpha/beta hydrolase [Mycolicibacterium sp. YH-1]